MAGFDAELYLRMLGERQLLSGEEGGHHLEGPLQQPAAALVAAGVVDATAAQRVLDDYLDAGALRSEHGQFRLRRARHPRPRAPQPLSRPRIAILDLRVPFASGRLWVGYVVIGGRVGRRGGEARLSFDWRRDPDAEPSGRAALNLFNPHGGGRLPAIVDDRGRTVTATMSRGGGGDDHYEGMLDLAGGPAPDAAWLEIEGVRVDLRDEAAGGDVTVEPLPEEDPVARCLWRRLAGRTHWHDDTDVELALGALAAAGAIEPDGSLARQVRAVAAELPDHPRHHHAGRAVGSARGLPEPWRSLLRQRGRDDGSPGAYVVGALTPVFDGVQVAVHALTLDAHGFEVDFEVAPNVVNRSDLQAPAFAWWARDDRGNHYLGSPEGWGGDQTSASGTLGFWPALDPKATRLDLLPTATTARAVISVELGESGRMRA